jgi:hypothetical protein
MDANIVNAITTHKIGKMTYTVIAAESENARDTISQKVDKLLIKNIQQNSIKAE